MNAPSHGKTSVLQGVSLIYKTIAKTKYQLGVYLVSRYKHKQRGIQPLSIIRKRLFYNGIFGRTTQIRTGDLIHVKDAL